MKTKAILVFLLAAMCCVSSFGQKNKKKPKDGAFASASATEAERIFTEGERHFILEDYTKALSDFQQALEYAPTSATSMLWLARSK